MDVGLYYREAEPFAIAAIKQIANSMSVQGMSIVTNAKGGGSVRSA